jgi:adenylate cyclase
LRVVARTSAFALKGMNLDIREIGRRLDVKAVLEGSVRKAGNRLRITAQLINVEDGFHLWSERYDRDMADIFAIQDEITAAIVDSLKVTLKVGEKTALRKRSTDDPEAYNLYLKGLYFFARPSPESYEKALGFFQAAIDKDPNFAQAHAGMGQVLAL